MHDPKQGEREYFARIGEEGRRHALRKPFSDDHGVEYVANAAALMALIPPPPARIVECGCGTGWLGQWFAARGYAVVGVDISPEAVALAEQLKAERHLEAATYLVADYEELQLPQPADIVLFHDALHHAESAEAALRCAFNVLRPGGMVICIEPGEGHSRAASSVRAVSEFGVHENDLPPRTILHHARRAGFRRQVVLPWPWFHVRSAYPAAFARPHSGFAALRRRLAGAFRVIRYFFRTRRRGMVVLWKD